MWHVYFNQWIKGLFVMELKKHDSKMDHLCHLWNVNLSKLWEITGFPCDRSRAKQIWHPLPLAGLNRHTEIVTLLILQGASIDRVSSWTPLEMAITGRHEDTAEDKAPNLILICPGIWNIIGEMRSSGKVRACWLITTLINSNFIFMN